MATPTTIKGDLVVTGKITGDGAFKYVGASTAEGLGINAELDSTTASDIIAYVNGIRDALSRAGIIAPVAD